MSDGTNIVPKQMKPKFRRVKRRKKMWLAGWLSCVAGIVGAMLAVLALDASEEWAKWLRSAAGAFAGVALIGAGWVVGFRLTEKPHELMVPKFGWWDDPSEPPVVH